MVDKTELAALVERVLGGDTRAYETIYLETKDNIYFYAKTVLKSDESAWDAVQDTFVAAFRSLEKLRTPATAETWLCAIAGNLCYARLKRQKPPADAAPSSAAAAPAVDADEVTVRRFCADALSRLSDMQRIAVLFRYVDDMSLAQIGSVMRCGESTVKTCLDVAEKSLCIYRDSAGAERGITPTQLKSALAAMQEETVLSPSITLSIGMTVAQKCGYSSALRVTAAAEPSRSESARHDRSPRDGSSGSTPSARRGEERSDEPRENERKRPPRPTPHERAVRGAKMGTRVLAAGLVVIGVVVGALAVRGIMDVRRANDGTPDNISSFYVDEGAAVRDDQTVAESAAVETEPLTSEQAQAYIGVITDYTGRFGVCTASTGAQGLAYARLIDFDLDGQYELYLYYIDKSFSEENQLYSVGGNGEALWCLHEELWDYDGALRRCFAQEHCTGGSVEDGTGASRWLVSDASGADRLVSWYSYTDENGYIHQCVANYAFADGELAVSEDVSSMFVVANAANQRRDGFLIEEYYGSDSSHYDDIAYFVEGAVTDADGRRAYNYEQCQAILDIGTADIVPLNDWDAAAPVAILKDSYDARRAGTQLICPDGFDGSGTLAWEVNDVNAFLSMLADICTGNG